MWPCQVAVGCNIKCWASCNRDSFKKADSLSVICSPVHLCKGTYVPVPGIVYHGGFIYFVAHWKLSIDVMSRTWWTQCAMRNWKNSSWLGKFSLYGRNFRLLWMSGLFVKHLVGRTYLGSIFFDPKLCLALESKVWIYLSSASLLQFRLTRNPISTEYKKDIFCQELLLSTSKCIKPS